MSPATRSSLRTRESQRETFVTGGRCRATNHSDLEDGRISGRQGAGLGSVEGRKIRLGIGGERVTAGPKR